MNHPRAVFFRLPVFLLLLHLAAYGLLIPWLGFYWDDWPSIWFLNSLGPQGFGRVFAEDRPLLGLLFTATTSVFGSSTIAWQVFGLLARAASGLAFWWLLRQVFPRQERLADFAAVLFAVYPGFKQQYISVTYSHVFLVQTLFFLSLGWMVQSVRRAAASGRLFTFPHLALSLLSAAGSMFTVEYFFGLELLRPLLLWLALEEPQGSHPRSRLRRTALAWAPYAVLLVVFLLWRVVWSATPRGDVTLIQNLIRSPASTLYDLLFRNVLPDVFEASLLAWAQTLDFVRLQNFGLSATAAYAGLVLLASGLAAWWLFTQRRLALKSSADGRTLQAERPAVFLLLGVFALLCGGWPFWATNLPVELRFPWDRFTLAMMPGASLLGAGLLGLLGWRARLQLLLLAALTGLAVGAHFENANLYRREWSAQERLFWQLSWRAPAIQPGTVLIASELPFIHFSDNSLTAPLNWIYAPGTIQDELPYLFYAVESRLGGGLQGLAEALEIQAPYRAVTFHGSTSQAVVLYYLPPGCVKILDPQTDARLPQKPNFIAEAYTLSNPGLIDAAAPQPKLPAGIFGTAPEPDWCYYFEKADLARYEKDWQQAAELGTLALAQAVRLYPVNAPELLPYIEAFAHTGEWQKARQLSEQALALTSRMDRSLCAAWQRIRTEAPGTPGSQPAFEWARSQLNCSLP